MERQIVGVFNSEVEAAQAFDTRVRALGLHLTGRHVNFLDPSVVLPPPPPPPHAGANADAAANNLTEAAKLLYRVVSREREESLQRVAELPSESPEEEGGSGEGHAEEKQEEGEGEEKADRVAAAPAAAAAARRVVVDDTDVDDDSLDSQDSDSDLAQSEGKRILPYHNHPAPISRHPPHLPLLNPFHLKLPIECTQHSHT